MHCGRRCSQPAHHGPACLCVNDGAGLAKAVDDCSMLLHAACCLRPGALVPCAGLCAASALAGVRASLQLTLRLCRQMLLCMAPVMQPGLSARWELVMACAQLIQLRALLSTRACLRAGRWCLSAIHACYISHSSATSSSFRHEARANLTCASVPRAGASSSLEEHGHV